VVFDQPRSEQKRAEAAEACVVDLKLKLPIALDEMSNIVDTAYAALPERLYLIDPEGFIRFRSDPGPWGFNIDAWEKAIDDEIKRIS